MKTHIYTPANKPYSSKLVITSFAVVGPVVTVESTTSTSIQISWTGSCSKVDKYEVKWERDTTRECRDVNLFNKTIINDSTSYNITELEEDSYYTIIVTANKSGIVVNSSIMEVTPEAGKDTFCGMVNDMKLCPFSQLHLPLPHVSVQLR